MAEVAERDVRVLPWGDTASSVWQGKLLKRLDQELAAGLQQKGMWRVAP